jgi:hypothetical protein
LAEGLANGDAVSFWDNGGPAQRSSTWDGSAWTGGFTGLDLDPGTTIWFSYAGAKSAFRYFAEGLDPERVEDDPHNTDVQVTVGDNDYAPHVYVGSTRSASAAGLMTAATELGQNQANPGYIYIASPTTPNVPLQYITDGSALYRGGQSVNPTIQHGAFLTFYRDSGAAGDGTINIEND